MCGLLGEYSFQNRLTNAEKFSDLLRLSKHRGPDATKVEQGKNYRLGFNRLALLDLTAAGEQPKKSPNQRFHLVFNGEIYNYKELSQKYSIENLRSTSDTEVVFHLFEAIGIIETLKQLNGMFAIAVVDTQTGELYLSRDFAGIKPLFFGKNKKGIVFASQFDQIFKHEWFNESLRLRKPIVAEYFAFGYMQAPNTIYETIFQVNPGECLVFDANGKQTNQEILKFSKTFDAKKNQTNQEELKHKLNHSIALQLNADRSLASFLSGGVDSSLVSAMAKLQKENMQAFTIQVEDPKFNEAEFAKSYAKHLQLHHTVESIQPEELLHQVDEHFSSFGEPFGDYSSLPTYVITKQAAKYHTAMLSGDGGDELFFGYPRMREVLQRKHWFRWPYLIRTYVVRISNALGITKTYAPFLDSLAQVWMQRHAKLPESLLQNTFENLEFSKELQELYDLNGNWNTTQTQHFLRWNEFYAHMQRILIKVDRTSMKNSLEVRVPFLDKEVIEYAWQNSHDISKLDDLKRPLKELVYKYIPKNLMMQTKKGFSIPVKEWLRTSLKIDLQKTLCQTPIYGAELFDSQSLIDYVTDFLNKKHDNEWGVWHIYAWQKWAINQGFIGK